MEVESKQAAVMDRDGTTNAGVTNPNNPFHTRWSLNAAQLTVGPVEPPPLETRKYRTGDDREDEGDAPARRVEWLLNPRIYPGESIPESAIVNSFLESVRLERAESLTLQPAMASSTQWQLLGPGNFAGRVTAIAVDPAHPQRIFVCTSSAGVWRSTDGGHTWADIGTTLGSNFTGAVAVDPHNSDVIYVCTGEVDIGMWGAGLYKSVDMGNHFSLTSLSSIAWASRIIVHPTNSSVVYAATNQGAFKSMDAGVTWTNVFSGAISDLVLNPSAPNVLYCGRWGDGIYKTTDGGATWTVQSGKPAGGFGRVRLTLCNAVPSTVYASFDASGKAEVWRTSDAGATWGKLPDTPDAGWGQLWYNHYIAVNPNNPNVVYTGQGTIFRTTNGGAGGGVGPGKAWQEINAPLAPQYTYIHVDHHCLTFDPTNPNTIYCGCDGGIYRSRFGGNYWEYIGASIPSSEFYAIGEGVQQPYEVGGGTQDNGTWLTDGNYERWSHILGGDGFYLVVDPTNPDTMYAEWQGLNINRSDNHGQSFAYKGGGIMEADPKPWMGIIELDKTNPPTLCVGTDRIYKTTNRMDTWSLLSCGDNVVLISPTKGMNGRVRIDASSSASAALGLSGQVQGANDANNNPATYARMVSSRRAPFALANGMVLKIQIDSGPLQTVTFHAGDFANIGAATAREVAHVITAQTSGFHAGTSASDDFTAIRVAPSNGNVVYAASVAQIWHSTDGGAHWTSIKRAPLPDRWITDIDVATSDPNSVYVAFSGFGTPHVYHSPDGGATWSPTSTGLPDTPASKVLVDPATPSQLWLATDQGVYTSSNSGGTWTRYSAGLPRVVCTDLKLHRNTGLLRVGTFGRGVWEIQATDVSLQITGARTASQGVGNRDDFRYDQDALALTLDVAASRELLNLGLHFDAVFEIIDATTNAVVRQVWTNDSPFAWGQFFWISRGNNWGPSPSDYTTPHKWGLSRGVYYFRGAILVRDADAFAVSPEKWFRVI